jgi:acetolactate synthase regulatory subunit
MMKWRFWRREPRTDGAAKAAQVQARAQLEAAKAQTPKVVAAERAARALARQTERLADDVERVMRLRGIT